MRRVFGVSSAIPPAGAPSAIGANDGVLSGERPGTQFVREFLDETGLLRRAQPWKSWDEMRGFVRGQLGFMPKRRPDGWA